MKLQVAVAAVVATKGLSREFSSLEFNKRGLSENDGNRKSMIQVLSELNLGDEGKRRNLAFRKLQKQLSHSSIQGPRGNNDKGVSNTDSLDLGILSSATANRETGGNDFDFDEDYRRLDEVVDPNAYDDPCSISELRGYFGAMHNHPYAQRIGAVCGIVTAIEGGCNVCDFPPVFDPETGLQTGEYYMKIDCPGLAGEFDNTARTFIEPLEWMCNKDYFCPDCGPICESCNTDTENWFVDNKNCFITEKMRMGLEAYSGVPADVVKAVDLIMYEQQDKIQQYFPMCDLPTEKVEADEDASSDEEPMEEVLSEDASSDEEPMEEVLSEDASSDEEPMEEILSEDASSDEEPMEDVLTVAAAAISAGEMISTTPAASSILRFVLAGASLFWAMA